MFWVDPLLFPQCAWCLTYPPKSFERHSLTRPLTYPSTLLLTAIDYYYQPRPSGNDDATATTAILILKEFWEGYHSYLPYKPSLLFLIYMRMRKGLLRL